MSIILKGIDMPKDIDELRLIINGMSIAIDPTKAIQIPTPHGRLIDASTKTTVESVSGTAMDVGMLLIALKQYVPTILGVED